MIQSGKIDSYIWILKKQLIYLLNFTIKRIAEIFGITVFFAGFFIYWHY